MKHYSVLIVEDDKDITDLLLFNLNREYNVLLAEDGLEAWLTLQSHVVDLILLDIGLPGLNGFEICKKVRASEKQGSVPIIFLTARASEDEVVYGFSVGCNDYIKKPFSVKELQMRIRSILKREHSTDEVYRYNTFEFNAINHRMKIDGIPIPLSAKEFNVLKELLDKRNKTVSREVMLDSIWGSNHSSSPRSVDIVITRLRSKLKKYGSCIRTVTSFGYQWNEDHFA